MCLRSTRLSYFIQHSWENGPNLSPVADLCTNTRSDDSQWHQSENSPTSLTSRDNSPRLFQRRRPAAAAQHPRRLSTESLEMCMQITSASVCDSPYPQVSRSLSPSRCLISALSWGSVARQARRDLEDGRSPWETFVILTPWWM